MAWILIRCTSPDENKIITPAAYESDLNKGKELQKRGSVDSALRCYGRVKEATFSTHDTAGMLLVCNLLGTLLVNIGPPDSAEYWYSTGMKLAMKSGNRAYQAGFAANLGLVFYQNGQLDSAMRRYTEAAIYYENLNDSSNMAQVYRNIGIIYNSQAIYNQAIKYYHNAIDINRKLGLEMEVSTDMTNLAVAFMMLGSDSAGYYYQKAMEIINKKGSPANLLPVQFNYANYLKTQGKLPEAEKIYRNVLETSKKLNIAQGQMFSLNQLGLLATIRKDSKLANDLFSQAISIAKENKLNSNLVEFFREAFQSNLELHNVDLALSYFKQWIQLNDSLKTIEQRDAVLKYQVLYETQILETKVNKLNSHITLQKSRNIIIGLILLSLLLLVSTLVIILFFRNRQANQKRKLAEQQALHSEQEKLLKQVELEKKTLEHQVNEEKVERLELEVNLREQDLVYQSLITTELNHVNRSVQEKLGPFQYRFAKKTDQEEFSQLLSEIIRDASKNPMKDFEVMFKQMHVGFKEKLLTTCPDFSRSELQVCALLRLNLASKDIARITNLSIATIEVTRHHIRKKLGLDQKMSLTSYLILL